MSKTWYRGTPNRSNDPSKFKGDIIWFTTFYDYAKSFAKAYDGIVVRANLDYHNTFDAGVTDGVMCKLFPVEYPFKLSPSMLKLLDKLDMNEEDFWKTFSSLEKNKQEFYKYKIFTLVRTTRFRNLLISKGYDSVKTIEFGNECLGVFSNKQITLKNTDDINYKGIDNLLKKIYNIDEDKRGSKMKLINEEITSDLKKSKLADYLGVDEEEIEEIDDCHFEVDNSEYLVCSYDEAYDYASEDIQDSYGDMGLDAFTTDFRDYILYNCLDKDFFDDVVREIIETRYDDDLDLDMSREEVENQIEKEIEDVDDSIEFIVDTFGEDFLDDLVRDNPNIVDMGKIVDACIDADGIAHFIAYYDGVEIELDNDLYAYRQN